MASEITKLWRPKKESALLASNAKEGWSIFTGKPDADGTQTWNLCTKNFDDKNETVCVMRRPGKKSSLLLKGTDDNGTDYLVFRNVKKSANHADYQLCSGSDEYKGGGWTQPERVDFDEDYVPWEENGDSVPY